MAGTAFAADPPPPEAPPAAAPAAPPAPMPPPPPAAAPPAVEAAKTPPTSTEAMPATRPDVLPPIDVGAWTRVGAIFQNGNDPKKMNDWHMDSAVIELHAGGKIHKKVGVTVNLAANMTNFGGADPTATPTPSAGNQIGSVAAVEDAIISFDFDDAFHFWAGHLLVPVDRANASGPFFMIPWNYPGFLTVGPVTAVGAPREGPLGRNNGAVVWGDVANNKLTYLVGAFDNAAVGSTPLYSGRLRLALLDTEPGFWGNGSFFGEKDIFSIGLGGQIQKTPVGKNYSEVNVDVLFEKKVGGGGWFTAEGAYYHFGGVDAGVSDSAYILAAFATGAAGVGNVQPMVRFQWLKVKAPVDPPTPINLDVGVAYLIKGPALRVLATYSYTKLDTDVTANSIQLGAQAIFF